MKFLKRFILGIFVVLLLSSCYTVEPSVGERSVVDNGDGSYTLEIYHKFNKKECEYAINQFVKSKGGESYDKKELGRGFLGKGNYKYTITMPGSIPVKDLPKMKTWFNILEDIP